MAKSTPVTEAPAIVQRIWITARQQGWRHPFWSTQDGLWALPPGTTTENNPDGNMDILCLPDGTPFDDSHLGDPCFYCGMAHDDVTPGPCLGQTVRLTLKNAKREADKMFEEQGNP